MPVLVGYVPTPEGRAALDTAISEAGLRSARLVVVNVSRGDALVDPRYASPDQWDDVQARLAESGVEYEVHQGVEAKDPAEQLIELAAKVNAELIVIGLRRRSPVGKLILGSQAQRILLDADSPVLAVKASR